jgi:hypothetical protein
MSGVVFGALAVAAFAVGSVIGLWRYAFAVPPVLWLAGLGAAALAGALDATAEDNTLGVFVFTGLPTVLWMPLGLAGVTTRRLVRGGPRCRSVGSPSGPTVTVRRVEGRLTSLETKSFGPRRRTGARGQMSHAGSAGHATSSRQRQLRPTASSTRTSRATQTPARPHTPSPVTPASARGTTSALAARRPHR